MGCTASSSMTPQEQELAEHSRQIDMALRSQSKATQKVTKMLIIGTGDTGKSTFFKQINSLYSDRPQSSLAERKRVVHRAIIQAAQDLIRGSEILGLPISHDNKDRAIRILQYPSQYDSIPSELISVCFFF